MVISMDFQFWRCLHSRSFHADRTCLKRFTSSGCCLMQPHSTMTCTATPSSKQATTSITHKDAATHAECSSPWWGEADGNLCQACLLCSKTNGNPGCDVLRGYKEEDVDREKIIILKGFDNCKEVDVWIWMEEQFQKLRCPEEEIFWKNEFKNFMWVQFQFQQMRDEAITKYAKENFKFRDQKI